MKDVSAAVLFSFHKESYRFYYKYIHYTSVIHMLAVSWRSNVLNQRISFFSCIFLDGSCKKFLLDNYRYACLANPASASDNLIGLDFYQSPVSFAQK